MESTWFISLLFLFCSGVRGQKQHEVTSECLDCLCKELTGCNLHRRCLGGTCGMFAITKDYWTDGGSLTAHSSGASGQIESSGFESCAKNYDCASKTIQNYMTRYSRDCNNDGIVDCLDYAAIHKHGPFGCSASGSSGFVQDVKHCLHNNPKDSLINEIDWRSDFK